ncbi:MAG TPA: hypothetical protein VIK04_10815 [Solirubrobacteraceae bacterium]
MSNDDRLGQVLRRELHGLGSDIHPSPDLMHRVLGDEPPQAHGRRQFATGRLAAVLALAAVTVAVLVLLTAGGGPSIVARAYAATSTDGVIVHYIQTLRFRGGATKPQTAVTEVWTSGQRRHLILVPGTSQRYEEITLDNGNVERYFNGKLSHSSVPATVLARPCGSIAILLGGYCDRSEQTSPLAALRALYKSGRLHAVGQTTANGRRVDLLEGSSGTVGVRALVDPQTFVPIEIEMTQTFTTDPRIRPIVVTATITDYQRLALTVRNRQLLLMRSHARARVGDQWVRTLRTLPLGSRTKNRRTPHGSSVIG